MIADSVIMKLLLSLYIFILCVSYQVECHHTSPVIIWREGQITSYKPWSPDVTDEISSDDFGTKILPDILNEEKKILVFVQDKINVEDFSLYTDAETPYQALKEKLDTQDNVYFGGVSMPMQALTLFQEKYEVRKEVATYQTDISKIVTKHFKQPGRVLVYVELPKTSSENNRENLLRKNDKLMDTITNSVAEDVNSFVVIFTAEDFLESSDQIHLGRHLLEAKEEEEKPADDEPEPIIMFKSECLLAYIKKITLKSADGSVGLPDPSNVSSNCKNSTIPSMTATWNDLKNYTKLELTISFKGSLNTEWKMSSMNLKVNSENASNVYKTDYVYAPKNFSYHCGGASKFKPIIGNVSLEINKLQVQPLFGGASDNFGRAYDCVGFFSVPILSSILISLMFAAIMFWAVSMVMGIQTMDQFDDPKGAAISVPQAD